MTYLIGWRGKTENVENRNVIKIEKKRLHSGYPRFRFESSSKIDQNGFLGQNSTFLKNFLECSDKQNGNACSIYFIDLYSWIYTCIQSISKILWSGNIQSKSRIFFWLWVMDKLVFGTWENMHHLLSRFLFLKIEPEVGNEPKIFSEILTSKFTIFRTKNRKSIENVTVILRSNKSGRLKVY